MRQSIFLKSAAVLLAASFSSAVVAQSYDQNNNPNNADTAHQDASHPKGTHSETMSTPATQPADSSQLRTDSDLNRDADGIRASGSIQPTDSPDASVHTDIDTNAQPAADRDTTIHTETNVDRNNDMQLGTQEQPASDNDRMSDRNDRPADTTVEVQTDSDNDARLSGSTDDDAAARGSIEVRTPNNDSDKPQLELGVQEQNDINEAVPAADTLDQERAVDQVKENLPQSSDSPDHEHRHDANR